MRASAAREAFEDEDRCEPWIMIAEQFHLGHTYDAAIVTALRKLDPDIAPLWAIKTYAVPGHDHPQSFGRHLIARHVRESRVGMKREDFDKLAIRGVIMPSVTSPELKGLPSGPYFECELLEGESVDGEQPGPYMPMTWDLVKRLEAAQWVQRTHTTDQWVQARLRRVQSARAKRFKDAAQDFRDRIQGERTARLQRRGELVYETSSAGQRVGMSEQLIRLRKIAAEGD